LNRDKNSAAKKRGAVGIIEVDPDNDIEIDWAVNFPLRFNSSYYEGTEYLMTGVHHYMTLPGDTLDSRLTELKVTMRLANELIKGCNINFSRFEKEVSASLEPASKLLTDRNIYVKTSVNSKIVKVRNVLGKIEGNNPGEIIVAGGHYDHVGTNKGYIWNGSDDNASGTVGVMTLAKAFAASGIKPEKTIIFALWTGEEYGLLGSEYFVDKYEAIGNVIYYLNYDMISRNSYSDSSGNKVSIEYTSSYPQIESSARKYNTQLQTGLDIEYDSSPKPTGGSDYASFSAAGIPVISFFTGFHDDYHGIGDHADKANIPKMTSIIKLGFSNMWEVATSKDKFRPAPEAE
jgi:Zn-dependent M28 family amino/carboxypeptidase